MGGRVIRYKAIKKPAKKIMRLKQIIESLIELSEDSWAIIQSSFTMKSIKKGEILLSEGQICKFVAFNMDGIIREYFYHKGTDTTSDFIFQESFFSSYSSFVNQTPSKVYLEALTDSQILVMDYQTKQKLFETVPEWDRLARKITEQHYTAKEQRTNILASMTAEERYNELLHYSNAEIIKNIPLKHIASYLGITPETLSRVRKRL
jgi:CRP-like cAMP-binding protein